MEDGHEREREGVGVGLGPWMMHELVRNGVETRFVGVGIGVETRLKLGLVGTRSRSGYNWVQEDKTCKQKRGRVKSKVHDLNANKKGVGRCSFG
jgi:hypothetical protein